MLVFIGVLAQLLLMNSALGFLTNGKTSVDLGSQNSGGVTSGGTLANVVGFTLGGYVIGFNLAGGVVVIIITSIILAIVAGIHFTTTIMGSGFSFNLAEVIVYGVVFYGLWILFSVFGSPLILLIPFFGVPIYFLMTLVYTLGVFEMMRVGGR
jgi:hypothetical protein